MAWWRRPKKVIGALPPPERRVVDIPRAARPDLARGEQVLACAQEDDHGHWLVLTTLRLLERTEEGGTVLERPWHEVDTGRWDPDAWVLSVSFVDALATRQWTFKRCTGPGQVPLVLRERTQASVVLMQEVTLGSGRRARVCLREDLATRELLDQVILARGASPTDTALAAEIEQVRRRLRAEVGAPD